MDVSEHVVWSPPVGNKFFSPRNALRKEDFPELIPPIIAKVKWSRSNGRARRFTDSTLPMWQSFSFAARYLSLVEF